MKKITLTALFYIKQGIPTALFYKFQPTLIAIFYQSQKANSAATTPRCGGFRMLHLII